jgi:hypothetical protein
MGAYRQALLYDCSTLMTLLTGEPWIHSDHSMTSSCSLVLKDSEECTPRGVENAFRQMGIFHHIGDLKVFDYNHLILLSVLPGDLEMMISALPVDLQMGFRDVASCFSSALRAFLATAPGAKHAIVNGARLTQALQEQIPLFLIRIKPILKRSHSSILRETMSILKRLRYPHPRPQTRNAFFIPAAKARGTQRRALVDE